MTKNDYKNKINIDANVLLYYILVYTIFIKFREIIMKKLLLAPIGFLLFLNVNGMQEIAHAATEPSLSAVTEEGKDLVVSGPVLKLTGESLTHPYIAMLPLIEGIEADFVPTAKTQYEVRIPVYKYEWNTVAKALGAEEKGGMKNQNQSRVVTLLAGNMIPLYIIYGKSWKNPTFKYAKTLPELGITE